jgi:hypothetical protein
MVRSRPPLHRRLLADPTALRYWVAAACAAALAGSSVADAADRATQARRSWGASEAVLVVAREVGPGQPLAGAVARRSWPEAMVPTRSVRSLPEGATAAVALDPGTALTEGLVRRPGSTATNGWRISLALPEVHLAVQVGDRVDVWTTDVDLPGIEEAAAARVARRATVIEVDDASVTVAVTAEEVPDLARAAALAPVVLVAR